MSLSSWGRLAAAAALMLPVWVGSGGNATADAVCNDGTFSSSEGSGTCSWHGGVDQWLPSHGEVGPDPLDTTPRLTETQRQARREMRRLVDDPNLLALQSECASRRALSPSDPEYVEGPTSACVEQLRLEKTSTPPAGLESQPPQSQRWGATAKTPNSAASASRPKDSNPGPFLLLGAVGAGALVILKKLWG